LIFQKKNEIFISIEITSYGNTLVQTPSPKERLHIYVLFSVHHTVFLDVFSFFRAKIEGEKMFGSSLTFFDAFCKLSRTKIQSRV